MKKNFSKLKAIEAVAHRAGHEATRVYGMVLFGTRHFQPPSAADAPSRRSADGIGLHSVWDGPLKVAGGAPILKRNRPA